MRRGNYIDIWGVGMSSTLYLLTLFHFLSAWAINQKNYQHPSRVDIKMLNSTINRQIAVFVDEQSPTNNPINWALRITTLIGNNVDDG